MFLKSEILLLITTVLCVCNKVACAENYTVIIIGAGAAGTAAAARLLESNITDILVLEAESRTGGRIHTVEFGDGYVDLGATFCQGKTGNVVYELAKKFDLFVEMKFENELFLSKGRKVDSEFNRQLHEVMMSVFYSDTARAGKLNAKDFYILRYNNTVTELFKNDPRKLEIALLSATLLEQFLASNEGTFSLSNAAANSDYKTVEDYADLRWNGTGYKIILDIITKKYPDPTKKLPFDKKLRLNKEVTKIRWSEEKVHLELLDGSEYYADYAIFTPSVGVLKHTHMTMFEPQLPPVKQEAIEGIGIDAISLMHFHFVERWWPEDNEFSGFSFIWEEADKEQLRRNFTKTEDARTWTTGICSINFAVKNPNVLSAWVTGSSIPKVELMDDETIINDIWFLLNLFLTPKYNVTRPDKVIRSMWYTNPHFRGTYSYQTPKINKRNPSVEVILAEPIRNKENKPVLLFAGEATHSHFYSTVHGAIETGYREADRIIHLNQNQIKQE